MIYLFWWFTAQIWAPLCALCTTLRFMHHGAQGTVEESLRVAHKENRRFKMPLGFISDHYIYLRLVVHRKQTNRWCTKLLCQYVIMYVFIYKKKFVGHTLSFYDVLL